MPPEQTPDPEAPALSELVAAIVAEQLSPANLTKQGAHAQNVALEVTKNAVEFAAKVAAPVVATIARLVLNVINAGEPVYSDLAKTGIDTLLGEGARRVSVPSDSGRRLIEKIAGGAPTDLAPSVDGAANYLTLMLNEELEAWVMGWITEWLTGIEVAGVSLGSVESFAHLEEIVRSALGGGRMIRRVLQPFMQATAITPAQWHVNKTYRPELLSVAATIDAHLAGRLSRDQLLEEISRQGLSLERIDTLVENARKRLSFADLVDLFQRGAISDATAIARAGELGYDEATAGELLMLATSRRRDRYKDPNVDAAVAAYLSGDIGDAELTAIVQANAPTLSDVPLIVDSAKLKRRLRSRQLSSSDERRLVKQKIRAIRDYERALERENFDPEAIGALSLELRVELDDAKAIEDHKADQARERAARDQAAADAKAKRDAELAARNALPTLQEYRRAYVHALIDRATLAAAIEREKISITAADLELLLADADLARADWLDAEERAKQARERDTGPGLTVAQLEAAVLAQYSTLADYDAALAGLGYDDDERRTLVQLLNGKLEDQAAARAAKAEAIRRAEVKRVSLPELERAVRLGLRTRDDYAAALDALETPAIARALLLDLLDAELAQDEAARQAREARDPKAAAAGLSLAQRRRAVVAGVLSRDAYADALMAADWPIADQLVELALVDVEAADAAAARARRDQVADEIAARDAELERQRAAARQAGIPAPDEPTLTLGQAEHAVRLGLLPPDALRDYLRVRGYVDADVETIVALAIGAVADVRAGQQRERQVDGELAKRGLSLAIMKDAVKRGQRDLEWYAGELAALGYRADDVALLRALLDEELAVDVDALRAKIRKALENEEGAPALETIDAALASGELDVAGARDVLVSWGVPRDTAIVYARLVWSAIPGE